VPPRLFHSCISTALAALVLTSAPADAAAQTIVGRVLDAVNERPVGGVMVSLVTRTGEARARALTDSIGRFRLSPPETAEYLLVTDRFGYLETRSPLFRLGTDGEVTLELVVSPEPVGLEGLEISVEELAAEELDRMGLSANALGNRWIGRRRIEAIPVKRDVGTILEHTMQAGTRIIRPEHQTGGDQMGLCVSLARANSMGRGNCALIVLDGIPISGVQALDIDPDAVESIAILEPIEASTRYGTIGGSGAVLVWTRRGR
jgi:hypothetical protein